MKGILIPIGAAACLASVGTAPAAEKPAALELSAHAGIGHTFGRSWDRSREVESSNGGFTLGIEAGYRTGYLFMPWLQLGWAQLYSGQEKPQDPEYAAQPNSESTLTAGYIVAGPAVEEGPLRFRVGRGAYRLQVRSTFAGSTINPVSWNMGYFCGYGVRLQRSRHFGWGLDAEGLLMSESGLAFLGLGIRGCYELD
jgi:hypothetical protein